MTPLQVAEERNRILRSLLELTAPLETERPDVTAVQQMVASREELLRSSVLDLIPGALDGERARFILGETAGTTGAPLRPPAARGLEL